jgi:thioredoxin-dependent peroxiredoxin
MLKEGDKAPDFTLDGPAGKVTLSKLLAEGPARAVVLYFYPKDKTPGCTREGQAFSAARKAFEKAGAVVYGISKDSVASHASFAESCGISVSLLSDPDLTVHRAFGAYGEKTMYGKKVLGTIRSTFVVGRDRTLVRVFSSVKVDGHADAVLAAITRASGASPRAAKTPTKKATKRAAPSRTAPAKKRSAR